MRALPQSPHFHAARRQRSDPSIFQSKDDPEIGFRFQYKVILKSEEAAAQRPVSFLGFWF
jgi:hypothetical protein